MNVKLAIGGFALVGGIFWAGAAYNRLSNMETSLSEIKAAIQTQNAALGEVPMLKLRISNLEVEVQSLQHSRDLELSLPSVRR